MSNSAVIRIDKTPLCIYTRWYGSFADVVAYANYAKLRNFGAPDVDPSGITSLIQVMTNCSGGGFGIEVMPYEESKKYETDNGTYVLEEWDVVDIEGHRGSDHELNEDIIERLIRIDSCQPEFLQLGDGFIRDIASRKSTFSGELAVGDVIWDRGDGVAPVRATIVGFGDSGYPYVHVDADPSSETGKPQIPDHYAREHFGKFLGNATWFARIPELSHPQAKASAFRGRPADMNAPGQVGLHADAIEAAEQHFESPVIFPSSDDATDAFSPVGALDSVEDGEETEGAIVESFEDVDLDIDDLSDIDEPSDDDVDMLDTMLGQVTEPAEDDEGIATNDESDFSELDGMNDSSVLHLDEAFTSSLFDDSVANDGMTEPMPIATDKSEEADADGMSNTELLQMVMDRGDEEDEFSLMDDTVTPSDADPSLFGGLGDFVDDVQQQHIVMTNADTDTEKVKIIQPLPQDESAIDAVTIKGQSDTGRSVFIPLEPYEIEPDFSTDAVAKNPSPYPDVLDADFQPYDEA